MKKTTCTLLLILAVFFVNAQDSTLAQSGTENNITNSVITATIDTPLILPDENLATKTASADSMYMAGRADAKKYYKGSGAATSATTFVTILGGGIIGLIPAISTASTTPSEKNLKYPNAELMKNPDYRKGYEKGAKKVKQGKIWTGYGIGILVNVVFALFLAAS